MSAVNTRPLFEPIKLGGKELKHRVVYAPLTRCRAIDTIPVRQMATYYEQRATDGGLMIAEATCISEAAQGYPHTPGIWLHDHVEAWRPITQAVRDKGATFYLQLWHVGRASHTDFQPGGVAPEAPSTIPITDKWEVYTTKGGPFKYPTPRAVTEDEIRGIVRAYADGAKNAIEAGFDGVEVHAANGYLLAQFVSSLTNTRTDKYGGSLENRARLLFEVMDAVTSAVGAHRVGIRLSPFNEFLDCVEPEPYETYGYIIKELNKYGLAYVHMVEPRVLGNDDIEAHESQTLKPFREAFDGPFIAAGGFKPADAAHAVKTHHADLVAFGRWFLSNPDLVRRIQLGAPLNKYDRNTFYTQDPVVGYLDYPFLSDDEVARLEKQTAAA